MVEDLCEPELEHGILVNCVIMPDVFIIIFGITVQELVQMSVQVLSDLVANHGKFNLNICVYVI